MAKSELQPSQFSLRSLIVLTAIAGVVLALSIPLFSASQRDGLYFAPHHLFGNSFFPFAAMLFFASPIFLIAIGVMLYRRKPRPIVVCIFLGFISIAVLQLLISRPYISNLYQFAQIASPILVALSLASIVEVAIRRLKSHYVTSVFTLPIGLAYWFMTSGIVSAV